MPCRGSSAISSGCRATRSTIPLFRGAEECLPNSAYSLHSVICLASWHDARGRRRRWPPQQRSWRPIMGAEQKVAIITGASQGIGEALVKAYRDRNYRVVANARSIKPSSDPDVLTVAGDIADPKTAERVVSQALERFGRIDTLVNNAGIFIAKPFTDYTDEDYANILNTNLNGF